jgi:hypothetical protein
LCHDKRLVAARGSGNANICFFFNAFGWFVKDGTPSGSGMGIATPKRQKFNLGPRLLAATSEPPPDGSVSSYMGVRPVAQMAAQGATRKITRTRTQTH